MATDIGARIRSLRIERGLSQEEVARRTGVGLKSYGDIERGRTRDPHYSTLRGVARALGVPVEELLQEEPVAAGKAEAPQETGPVEHEEGDTLSPEEEESGVVYAMRGVSADEVLSAVDEILSSSLADATDRPGEPLSRLEITTHSDGSTDLVIRRVAKHAVSTVSKVSRSSKSGRYVSRIGKKKARRGKA